MAEFLSQNIGTIVVLLIVAAAVFFVIFSMIKKRRQGKSTCSCGCGCSNCPSAGMCRTGHKRQSN